MGWSGQVIAPRSSTTVDGLRRHIRMSPLGAEGSTSKPCRQATALPYRLGPYSVDPPNVRP